MPQFWLFLNEVNCGICGTKKVFIPYIFTKCLTLYLFTLFYTVTIFTFTGSENVLHLLYYNKIHNLEAWLWVINWCSSCIFAFRWHLWHFFFVINFCSTWAMSVNEIMVMWISSLSLLLHPPHFLPSPYSFSWQHSSSSSPSALGYLLLVLHSFSGCGWTIVA